MRSSNLRRWTLLWVLGFLATTAMGFQDAPGDAEEQLAPAPLELEIVEQSASVATDELFVIRVDSGALDTTAITVDVAVYPEAIGPEPQLEPGDQEPLVSSDDEDAAAAEVLVTATGLLTIRIPIGAEAADGELTLPGPGVYPLRLSLTDAEGVVAEATTTLIHRARPGEIVNQDDDPEEPTDAEAEPDAAVMPTGPRPLGLVLDVGNGALTLAQVTEILESQEDLAATIVIHRAAIAELERDDDALDDFRDALGEREVVVGTSTALDPAALTVVGQTDAYRLAREQIQNRMDDLDIATDRQSIIIDAPLTPDASTLLAELGITTAIAHRLASPGSGEPWPVTSGMVDGGAAPLFVLGTDIGRPTATAAADERPVTQANSLLAQLAVSDEPAPLVGELARLDEPTEVVELLADPSLSSLWTLVPITDDDFQKARAGSVVALREAPALDLSPSAPALARIEDLLQRYLVFYADGPNSPGYYRSVLMEAFRTDMSQRTRESTLGRVEAELTASFDQITLPGNQSVTLAAQSAPLPVAVANTSEGARYVRVQVTSDKITMADPDVILRVEPGMSAIDVPVRTRSLGASPLSVTLLSPDGSQVLASTRFQVRSTAVPGLGLLISALGLGALLVWWYLSVRRSRREDGDNPVDLRQPDDPAADQSARSRVRAGDSV